MDNNLIKIDDLVRQRLSGGEEREPSGAWLRMRELLDEEEDRKPAAFIWRRVFGALGVLVLLAALSLGGYELTSKYHLLPGGTQVATTVAGNHSNHATPVTGSAIAPTGTATGQTGVNSPRTPAGSPALAANNNTANNNNHQHNNSHKHHTTANANRNANHDLTATSDITATTDRKGEQNTVVAASNKPDGNHPGNNSGNNKQHPGNHPAGIALASNSSDAKHPSIQENTDKGLTTSTSAPETKDKSAHRQLSGKSAQSGSAQVHGSNINSLPLAAAPSGNSVSNGTTGTATFATTDEPKTENTGLKTAKHNRTARHNNDVTPGKNDKNGKNNNGVASHRATGHKTGVQIEGQSAKGTTDETAEGDNTTADAGSRSGTKDAKPVATAHNKQLPANSGSAKTPERLLAANMPKTKAPAAAKKTGSGTAVSDGENGIAAKSSAKHAKKNGGTPTHTAAKQPGAAPANILAASAGTNGKVTGKPGEKQSVPVLAKTEKRQMERITIRQRLMQTGPNTYAVHMDTISIEEYTGEFAIKERRPVFGPPASVDAIEPGSAAAGNEDAIAEKPDENVLAAAAPAPKPEPPAKKKGAGKSDAFAKAMNDLKFKMSGARFAAGLKGGINGTFFGPNDFKGFQFGVTGSFIFSESVTILAELEYFHRINNNFVLNDNYYTYTEIPNTNMWSKQQISAPYSFSTLHSFELPLILQYSKGNFNIFGGGNMVYSMAINEGIGTPVTSTGMPATVTSISNDNAPKIQANDFKSRFGFGYLFGLGVQLSPVVSMDIRDVQTVWDNSKGEGGKEISRQLYRSPSFQVSFGYRFGGRKGKDKE